MALFDGIHLITTDQVVDKMNYFIKIATDGMQVYETNPAETLEIAKRLRAELESEYKNNNLKRISDAYDDDLNFVNYSSGVHQATASITGKTTKSNVFSFLYDVDDYMRYHLPK